MKSIKNKAGFTLAEMMVVMLILTIILAAFAPFMTKRRTVDTSSPWRYASNNSDIYYGLATDQTAMLGQNTKDSADPENKFTIRTTDSNQYHILFKDTSSILGALNLSSSNLILGNRAVYNNSPGSYVTAFGMRALSNSSGSANTALGYAALQQNTGGANNTAIGYQACLNVTGSNKTCIGANSGPDAGVPIATDATDAVYLGNVNSTVYIPGNLIVGGSIIANNNTYLGKDTAGNNVIYIGFNGVPFGRTLQYDAASSQLVQGGVMDTTVFNYTEQFSDKRLKNITGENKSGLDQIRELKVYNYTFKNDKDKKPQVGVIAQDLQKIFPDAVREGLGGYLMIRQDDMFYAMVNSIKQLDMFVQGIINELKATLEKITGLDERIKVLEEENKSLKEELSQINKRLEELEEDD